VRTLAILTLLSATWAFTLVGDVGVDLFGRKWHSERKFNMRQFPRPGQMTCDEALSIMDASKRLTLVALREAAKAPKESPGRQLLTRIADGASRLYLVADSDRKRACKPL
jgi:hypothetical protein